MAQSGSLDPEKVAGADWEACLTGLTGVAAWVPLPCSSNSGTHVSLRAAISECNRCFENVLPIVGDGRKLPVLEQVHPQVCLQGGPGLCWLS